ncbi:MAG: NDP-sugar synthase, partial [Solirubrobacterales bacterium]|nr:NDP-sugar synthase [Solirubrobacterales bacterium]
GGEGTRLRPLTSTIPKPVVPLAGKPFIVYMLEWLRRHGVTEVILACGFMADDVRAVLGDGAALGLRLLYVEEPRPLGTGGALKFAQGLLQERFLMLNGDVLTDIDLAAALRQHEATGARATLALVQVADPSAYGLVVLRDDGSVRAFVEKPGKRAGGGAGTAQNGADAPNLINAGIYVLERDVLEYISPAGTVSSIERDVFPRLVGNGLFGHPTSGYWLDIGTPERYLRATFDLLDGTAGPKAAAARAQRPAHAVDPVLIAAGSMIGEGVIVGPYVVLGPDVSVGDGVRIERAVVLEGAAVGAGSTICEAIVGPRARIGDDCHLQRDVVLGEGAAVASGSAVATGARIFPGVVVSESLNS